MVTFFLPCKYSLWTGGCQGKGNKKLNDILIKAYFPQIVPKLDTLDTTSALLILMGT